MTYKKYEMESAMIKMIRRCDDDALYWAYRLSQVKGGNKRIWERLEIMSAEDIGMAYPWLRTYLYQQQENFLALNNQQAKQVLILTSVCFFTRQYKSRLCDNIAHAYFKDRIPNVGSNNTSQLLALFEKNIQKKASDKALQYAANLYQQGKEAAMIALLKQPEDPESRALIRYFQQHNRVQRDYHDLLFLINLILYRTMDIQSIPIRFEIPKIDLETIYSDKRQLVVPDCAYDYHCTIGRNLGRGYQHYYEEGAKLNQCFIPDSYEALAKAINIPKDQL